MKPDSNSETTYLLSIIVPTITKDSNVIRRLCKWFIKLESADCELIIIDQFQEDRNQILEDVPKNIIYIHNKICGLSKNRNIGISVSSGKYLLFLDDDCWFHKNYIKIFNDYLNCNTNYEIFFSNILNEHGHDTKRANFQKDEPLSLMSIDAISASGMIAKRSVALKILFDERMGVGSKYGSCEEFDFLARSMEGGSLAKALSGLVIFHPEPSTNIKREYNYGRGHGYLCHKRINSKNHIFLNFCFVAKRVLIAFLKYCIAILEFTFNKKKARLRIHWCMGFLEGLLKK